MTEPQTAVTVLAVIAAFFALMSLLEKAGERRWFDRFGAWLDWDRPKPWTDEELEGYHAYLDNGGPYVTDAGNRRLLEAMEEGEGDGSVD